jgi:hypothetical protein
MITLINKKRFKKATFWQTQTDDYEQSLNTCCDMAIVTFKYRRSFSRLHYAKKSAGLHYHIAVKESRGFTQKVVGKLLNGTSYLTALSFILGDLDPSFNVTLDAVGFLELVKCMDTLDHIVPPEERLYVQGRLSVIVIPPDFLKYKPMTRKCFYIKMLGIYDWGRAYFIAKEVLVDMFKLLPTYLAYRCGLLAVATQEQEDSGIFDSVVSVFDINGQLKASKRKHLVVNAQTLFKVICKQLNVKDLSNYIDSTEKYRVKIIEEKKKNVAKSRKKRKV